MDPCVGSQGGQLCADGWNDPHFGSAEGTTRVVMKGKDRTTLSTKHEGRLQEDRLCADGRMVIDADRYEEVNRLL